MPFLQLFASVEGPRDAVSGDVAAGAASDLAGALGLEPGQVLVQVFFADAASLPSVVGIVRSSARTTMPAALQALRRGLASRFGLHDDSVFVGFEEIRGSRETGENAPMGQLQ